MGFRRQDLQEAFFVPGTYDFQVWGYGTADPLEEAPRPSRLRGGRESGERRVALVMVSDFERGDATVRLVQDFGRAEDDARAAAIGEPAAADRAHRPRGDVRRSMGYFIRSKASEGTTT